MTTESELEAAGAGEVEDADFTPAEKAVLRFTNAFYADHRAVSDEIWDELKRHYSEPDVIEIAWTISTYIMLGKLIHAFRIPYGGGEDGAHGSAAGHTGTGAAGNVHEGGSHG